MVAGATAWADANSGRATVTAAIEAVMNLFMMKNRGEAIRIIVALVGAT
jgi:hypothetical protein